MIRAFCASVVFGLLFLGVSSILADHRPDSPDQGKGPNKVKLCHVEEVVELAPEEEAEVGGETVVGPGTVTFAHVIEVSSNGNAVDAHLAHGDSELPEDTELEPGDDCSSFERDEPDE